MSRAQARSVSVRMVEAALADLLAREPQTSIAGAIGLACHSQISRRLGRVLDGSQAYVEAFSLREGLDLAQTYSSVGLALAQAAGDHPVAADPVERTADALATAGHLVTRAAGVLADGKVSHEEAKDLAALLDQHEQACHRLRAALAGRADRPTATDRRR
jgi:hypothetical protein